MGVIQRQGIKGTIALYIGMLWGYFNILWLFPYCLSPEEIGVVRTLFDASSLFLIVASFGVSQITLRFFPYFKDEEKGHNGFLGFLLTLFFIGNLVFLGVFYVFNEQIQAYFGEKSQEFLLYFEYTIPFTFLLGLFNIFFYYSSSLYRIVVPNIIQNIYIRLCLSLLVIAYFFKFIPFDWVAQGYVWIYGIGAILLLLYVKSLGQLYLKSWNFIGKISKKSIFEMMEYGVFSILTNTGVMLIFQIDTLMISATLGLKYTGVYFIALSMANIIEVPGRALVQISVPVLSQAMKDNDESLMLSLYKKTAITQLIVGGILFLLLAVNVENLFSFIPKASIYSEGIKAFYWIGLAKLVSISIGIGGSFITYAKYYKFNMIVMLVMLLATIGLNDLLTPYGMEGIAFATFLTLLVVTLIKIFFVKWKYGFFPYTFSSVKFIVLLAIFFFGIQQIPFVYNVYVDIIVRTSGVVVVFLPIIYFLKISPDLNGLFEQLLTKFKK